MSRASVMFTGLVALIMLPIGVGFSTSHTALQATPTMDTGHIGIYDERLLYDVIPGLRSHEDCALPCFWGVTPGESTTTEMRTFIESNFYYDAEVIEILRPEYFSPADNNVAYQTIELAFGDYGALRLLAIKYIDTDQIFFMTVNAYDTHYWLPPGHQFEIDHFLTALGEPSEVFLELVVYPSSTLNWYKLRLVYRELGLIINYDIGFDERDLPLGENSMRFCTPQSQIQEFAVVLFAPDLEQPFEPFIHSLLIFNGDYPGVANPIWSLDNMTDMTIPEFTRFFTENPEGCIEGISFDELLEMHPAE